MPGMRQLEISGQWRYFAFEGGARHSTTRHLMFDGYVLEFRKLRRWGFIWLCPEYFPFLFLPRFFNVLT